MKKLLFLLLTCTLSLGISYAQSVSGTVTDGASGDPLEGVTVMVKGTTSGILTDQNGKFTLAVPSGEANPVLLFSYVGKAPQEVPYTGQSNVSISLAEQDFQVDEVVVTAYGITRDKKAIGYGVENLDGDKLARKSEPDALRGIQGKIAGVNITGSSSAPGSSTRITIRGNSSLTSGNQPLFVVDGIPYNNANNLSQASFNQLTGSGATSSRIADIDPNNIKSITVLKGAAASSLYGVRAANGVVIIETKSGSSSLGQSPLSVTVSSSVTIENVASLPNYQNTYGTGTNFAYSQVNGSWGAPFPGTRDYANVTEIPHWYRNEPGFENLANVMVPYQAYPDNVRNFFQTGIMYDNSISLNAGTKNASIGAVLSFVDQDGFVPNTNYKKFNLGLGGKAQSNNERLTVDWNFNFTNSKQLGSTGGANNAIGNSSQFARTMFMGRNWDLQGQPYISPVDSSSVFFVARTQATNPRWSTLYEGISTDVNRFASSSRLNYKLTDWLSASYSFGLNNYSEKYTEWYNPGSRAANQIGRVTVNNTTFTELESNFLVTAQKDLSEDFYVKAVVGNNVNQRTTDAQAIQGTGYVTFNINDLDNTNAVIPFGGDYSRQRIVGYFGDVTASFRNYLFLNGAYRRESASTLPEATRNFGYGSTNLSFVFTDAFDLEGKIFTFGKIRAGYGTAGNAPGPYLTRSVFLANPAPEATSSSFADFPFTQPGSTGVPGATLEDRAYDPNLKSELTREVELGLELRFFQNRLGIDVAVYERNVFDQFNIISIPSASGFREFFTNIGQTKNRGIELTVDMTPLKIGDFKWNLLTTFTHNRNTVEDLGEGTDEITLRNTFGGSVSAIHKVGEEFGLIRGTVSARDDEGNLLIDPSNGQLIRALDEQFIANPNPDFIMGFSNTFSYKGFNLNAVVDYRQGGDLYSTTILSLLGRGVTQDTEDREIGSIIPGVYGDPSTGEPIRDGDGNKIQNATMIEENSLWFGESFAINGADEWNVFDATVIRLREVSLGYSLPQKMLKKSPLSNVTLNVVGRNLWFSAPNFPEHTNFDPETNTFGNTNAQGFEFTTAPSSRRFGLDLRISF